MLLPLFYLRGDQCKCAVLYNGESPLQYTVDPMLLPSGIPMKCHEEFLSFTAYVNHLKNVLARFPHAWVDAPEV